MGPKFVPNFCSFVDKKEAKRVCPSPKDSIQNVLQQKGGRFAVYLHLGQSIVIPTRDILGIFDLDHASCSHLTRDFLRLAEEKGRVVTVSEELPKSFVHCCTAQGNTVYISQLSSTTLLKRAELGFLATL